MEIQGIDILAVDLPFRIVFGHSLATRKSTTNLWVRVRLKDGGVGHGEAVPRAYVTGEDVDGAARAVAQALDGGWWRGRFGSLEEVAGFLEARYEAEGPEQGGAARCALELALLDAAGKRFGRSCVELLGGIRREQVEYSAVIPFFRRLPVLLGVALRVRREGLRTAKVKVGQGTDRDLRALRLIRWAIGRRGDLRVDANSAWSAEGALQALKPMFRYGIRAVEQPLPAEDVAGLARVAAAIDPLVIVDESFHTIADARRLIDRGACDALNIRISKCGGLLTSRRILLEARERGIPCQLGAQVGESGVLTAAGRAFACAHPDLLYCEGAAGRFLLEEDLTEDVSLGPGGFAPALRGPGLGVTVDPKRLARRSRLLATVD